MHWLVLPLMAVSQGALQASCRATRSHCVETGQGLCVSSDNLRVEPQSNTIESRSLPHQQSGMAEKLASQIASSDQLNSHVPGQGIAQYLPLLTDQDWARVERLSGYSLVGNKANQDKVKRFILRLKKEGLVESNPSRRALHALKDWLLSKIHSTSQWIQSHRLEIAAYVVLFIIVVYSRYTSRERLAREIDESYHHPDQDPELRPGETMEQRKARLDRVWKEKLDRHYEKERNVEELGHALEKFGQLFHHHDAHVHHDHHDVHVHHDAHHFHW
jgi:hypothetical protein